MTVFPLLAVGLLMNAVAVLFVICCIALVLIILIQKGKGGGLSGAFGGAMASGILGSKTGDFLTWVTIVLAGIVLSLGVVMGKYYKPSTGKFGENTPPSQVQPETQDQTISDANDVNSPGS
jgi:preprotein translocase subunit SecG